MTQNLTEVIARQVKKLRTEQRLSAQALADLCAKLGSAEINRDVIANLESGRRRSVTVAEVAILAFALGVSPSHLMVDHEDSSPIAVTGRIKPSGRAMRAWLAGRAPLKGQDPRRFAGQAVPWMADLPAIDEDAIARWRRLDEIGKTLLPPVEDEAELERISKERAELFAKLREDVEGVAARKRKSTARRGTR